MLVGMCLFLTTCAHSPPTAPVGHLRIKCCATIEGSCPEPDTMSRVFIDGTFAGECGDWPESGRSVRAGRHHLDIERSARGWARSGREVVVPDGGEITVEMYYARTPD
jgi:hypothetical protein